VHSNDFPETELKVSINHGTKATPICLETAIQSSLVALQQYLKEYRRIELETTSNSMNSKSEVIPKAKIRVIVSGFSYAFRLKLKVTISSIEIKTLEDFI